MRLGDAVRRGAGAGPGSGWFGVATGSLRLGYKGLYYLRVRGWKRVRSVIRGGELSGGRIPRRRGGRGARPEPGSGGKGTNCWTAGRRDGSPRRGGSCGSGRG